MSTVTHNKTPMIHRTAIRGHNRYIRPVTKDINEIREGLTATIMARQAPTHRLKPNPTPESKTIAALHMKIALNVGFVGK